MQPHPNDEERAAAALTTHERAARIRELERELATLCHEPFGANRADRRRIQREARRRSHR